MEEMKNNVIEAKEETNEVTEVKESMWKKVSTKVKDGAKKHGPTAKKVLKVVGGAVALGAAFALGKNLSSKDTYGSDEVGEIIDAEYSALEESEEVEI